MRHFWRHISKFWPSHLHFLFSDMPVVVESILSKWTTSPVCYKFYDGWLSINRTFNKKNFFQDFFRPERELRNKLKPMKHYFLSVWIIEIQLYFYICLWCEESLDLTSCQDLLVFPTSGGLWFRPDQSLLDAITDGIDEVFSESPI